MATRTYNWFSTSSLKDPIERHIAPVVYTMLLGLGATPIVGSLLWFLSEGGLDHSLRPYAIAALIVFSVVLALISMHHGRMDIAGISATTGLLVALGINLIGLGMRAGAPILIAFVLPIAMSGFLAGRRGLLLTIALSLIFIIGTAILERYAPSLIGYAAPEGLPINTPILIFMLVAGPLGLFIERFSRALRQALSESLAREYELERIHSSLEARTAELSRAKEQMEHELVVRKLAEAALKNERDLLHALMDNIPDTIYFKDTASRFTRINRAQAQFLGIASTSAAVGKTDHDFQPLELAQTAFAEEQQIVATGQPLIDRLEFNPTADGRPRWLSSTKVPLKNEAGQVIGIVGVSRDITARQEIDRLKSEFIATVSHELRTPLTSIRGSLGLLAGGVAGDISPAAKTMVDIAYKNSERLARLVNDILDIERIESGKLAFQIMPLDLSRLVEQSIDANSGYAEQFNVTFRLIETMPGARVQGDVDRLTQVLTNLLSNAAKFSSAGDTIDIAVARRDRMLRISVTDHGPGVPEAFRTRIFSKFAQADGSSTRQKSGAGLGLSIAKAIVERHGGRIDYTSHTGQGATFFVDLPEWASGEPDTSSALEP
jgi:PAS domain S-box-containing protein